MIRECIACPVEAFRTVIDVARENNDVSFALDNAMVFELAMQVTEDVEASQRTSCVEVRVCCSPTLQLSCTGV